jgi:hypothetical protein
MILKRSGEKKTLYYYLWVPSKLPFAGALEIHKACLKEYHSLFDDAVIFIAVDDDTSDISIKTAELTFLELGFSNIRFKVVKNVRSREAEYFFSDIVSELANIDGAVFFAHSKAVTNLGHNPNSIIDWICSMYYFNLDPRFQDSVDWSMFYADQVFHGIFKFHDNNIFNKYKYIYAGTFFWLHPKKLNQFISSLGQSIPDCVYANSAENFPGNVMPSYFAHTDFKELDHDPNLYDNASRVISDIVSNKEIMDEYNAKKYKWIQGIL